MGRDIFSTLISKCNNTKHRTIFMKPQEINPEDEKLLLQHFNSKKLVVSIRTLKSQISRFVPCLKKFSKNVVTRMILRGLLALLVYTTAG